MLLYACCPQGHEITGTYELVPGCASVDFERDADGKVSWEHNGMGTDMFWDGMVTQKRASKTLFLCCNGDEFTEDELVFEDQA